MKLKRTRGSRQRKRGEASRHEIIMLVELDPQSEDRIQKDLEAGGFPVVTAENTAEALDIIRFIGDRVTLTIVDEERSGGAWRKFLATMHNLYPAVKAVLLGNKPPATGMAGFLRKPVRRQELVGLVLENAP
jgi:DNA-binding NtrC family response regulator